MSSAGTRTQTGTDASGTRPVDLKLEVVLLGVSDPDRSKAFYESLGWRLDGDFRGEDGYRCIQELTTRFPGRTWV